MAKRSLENNGKKDVYEVAPQFEIVVEGNKRQPYRSYYQEANNRMLQSIGATTKKAIGTTIDAVGNAAFAPFIGYLALKNYLHKDKDSYNNEGRQFDYDGEDNTVTVKNGVTRNLLGMTGAVKGDDGIYRYRNESYQGPWKGKDGTLHGAIGGEEYLRWCAENANRFNRYFGKPTAGNAWTRHGIYGDSAIVVSPHKKSDYTGPLKERRMAGDQAAYVKDNIENHKLMTGDIVDMYYNSSSFLDDAAKYGDENRVNTHTGTILKTSPRKEDTFVVHSMGNGLKVEPIGQFIGSRTGKPYITGIRRPGTKTHNYKSK